MFGSASVCARAGKGRIWRWSLTLRTPATAEPGLPASAHRRCRAGARGSAGSTRAWARPECRACAYCCVGAGVRKTVSSAGESARTTACAELPAPFYEHAPALRAIGMLIAAGRPATSRTPRSRLLGVHPPTPNDDPSRLPIGALVMSRWITRRRRWHCLRPCSRYVPGQHPHQATRACPSSSWLTPSPGHARAAAESRVRERSSLAWRWSGAGPARRPDPRPFLRLSVAVAIFMVRPAGNPSARLRRGRCVVNALWAGSSRRDTDGSRCRRRLRDRACPTPAILR